VIVPMVWIEMAVRMRVAGAVRMRVFVFVEDNFQAPAERTGNAAQSSQAWDVIAALEARDHRFRHRKSFRELSLRLARLSPQLEQASRALRSDRDAVIRRTLRNAVRGGLLHADPQQLCEVNFAQLLNMVNRPLLSRKRT
jgi:hypothetical protein